MEWINDYLKATAIYWGYFIIFATALIVVRLKVRVQDHIFRKLLHFVAFISVFPLIQSTEKWYIAFAVQLTFLALVIIALSIFERFSFYKDLFVEKGRHEVIISFVLMFSMVALMILVFWGLLSEEYKYIIPAAIMAWGPGDAAAAIVGKSIGKHKLSGKMIEGVKSVEGTLSMGITSFIFTAVTLFFMSGLSTAAILLVSIIIAISAALTELFTKHGLDTVTVPVIASVILYLAAQFK